MRDPYLSAALAAFAFGFGILVVLFLTGCVVTPPRIEPICAGSVHETRQGGIAINPPHPCEVARTYEQPRYLPF